MVVKNQKTQIVHLKKHNQKLQKLNESLKNQVNELKIGNLKLKKLYSDLHDAFIDLKQGKLEEAKYRRMANKINYVIESSDGKILKFLGLLNQSTSQMQTTQQQKSSQSIQIDSSSSTAKFQYSDSQHSASQRSDMQEISSQLNVVTSLDEKNSSLVDDMIKVRLISENVQAKQKDFYKNYQQSFSLDSQKYLSRKVLSDKFYGNQIFAKENYQDIAKVDSDQNIVKASNYQDSQESFSVSSSEYNEKAKLFQKCSLSYGKNEQKRISSKKDAHTIDFKEMNDSDSFSFHSSLEVTKNVVRPQEHKNNLRLDKSAESAESVEDQIQQSSSRNRESFRYTTSKIGNGIEPQQLVQSGIKSREQQSQMNSEVLSYQSLMGRMNSKQLRRLQQYFYEQRKEQLKLNDTFELEQQLQLCQNLSENVNKWIKEHLVPVKKPEQTSIITQKNYRQSFEEQLDQWVDDNQKQTMHRARVQIVKRLLSLEIIDI